GAPHPPPLRDAPPLSKDARAAVMPSIAGSQDLQRSNQRSDRWPRNALTHENTKPVSRRFQGSITSGGIRMLRKPSLPRSPSHWYEHGEPVASALGRTSHERKARQVSLHHARSHVMTENSKLMSRRELMQVGLAAGMVALPSRALGQTSGDVITRPIPSSGERVPVIGIGTNQFG